MTIPHDMKEEPNSLNYTQLNVLFCFFTWHENQQFNDVQDSKISFLNVLSNYQTQWLSQIDRKNEKLRNQTFKKLENSPSLLLAFLPLLFLANQEEIERGFISWFSSFIDDCRNVGLFRPSATSLLLIAACTYNS